MLNRGIQSCSSTNCISEVLGTNLVYNGIVTRKPSTEPIMARMRASGAFLSSPVASTRMPNMIGSQIATLITGNPKIMLLFLYCRSGFSPTPPYHVGLKPDLQPSKPVPHGQQHEYADDHGKRIVVDIPGLEMAHHAREHPDQLGRAVHHHPVDQLHVAELPQEAARAARTASEEPVVETVEVILVVQQGVDEPEALLDRGRDIGALEVKQRRTRHS